MAAPEEKAAGCRGHGSLLQAVGALRAKRPRRPEAVGAAGSALAFVRSMGGGSADRSAPPRVRSLLASVAPLRVRFGGSLGHVLRVLLGERFAYFVRYALAQHPGRTLRFDRTGVRSAQVGTNDLTGEAEFGRQILGANGSGRYVRHAIPFARAIVCSIAVPVGYRTNAPSARANERTFTKSLQYTPPYRPPRCARLSWRRKSCRAKRAGCLIFGAIAAACAATATASLPYKAIRAYTPGATFAGVTASDVCTPGWATAHRHVTTSQRHRIFAEYGVDYSLHARYELDHLIPLETGGSNSDRNLWPEPLTQAHEKDRLEDFLHDRICGHAITLRRAWALIRREYVS